MLSGWVYLSLFIGYSMGGCCDHGCTKSVRVGHDAKLLDLINRQQKGINVTRVTNSNNTIIIEFKNPHHITDNEILANLAAEANIQSIKKIVPPRISTEQLIKIFLVTCYGLLSKFIFESMAYNILSAQVLLSIVTLLITLYTMQNKLKLNGMQIAQMGSILILWSGQFAGLFMPNIGFPMPHWHHLLFMSFVLLVTETIKQFIRNPINQEIKADKTQIFNAPIINKSTYELKPDESNYLPFDSQLPKDVKVRRKVLCGEGEEWAQVDPNFQTVFSAGTKVKVDKNIDIKKSDSKFEKFKDITWIDKLSEKFPLLVLGATCLSATVAFILHLNVISIISSTLIVTCPCMFYIVDPLILLVVQTYLKDWVQINNNKIDEFTLFKRIHQTRDTIWDYHGTLSKEKNILREESPFVIHNTPQSQVVSGSKIELNDIKNTQKVTDKAAWFKEQKFDSPPLWIGDGPNDAKVFKETNVIGGCVKSEWGHGVSKWACFKLINKDHPLLGVLNLKNVSTWAYYTQNFCHAFALVYTLTVLALTIGGVITNPMIACILLCASALAMPGVVGVSLIFMPKPINSESLDKFSETPPLARNARNRKKKQNNTQSDLTNNLH